MKTTSFALILGAVLAVSGVRPVRAVQTHATLSQSGTNFSYSVFNDENPGSSLYLMAFHLAVHAPFTVTATPPGWTYESDNFTYVDWLATNSSPPFTNNIAPRNSLTGFALASLDPSSEPLPYAVVPWDVSTNAGAVAFLGTIAAPTVTNLSSTLTQISPLAPAGVQLTVPGFPTFSYVIESSTNLSDWTAITTNAAPLSVTEPNSVQTPTEFFRSWFLPDPSSWPVLPD